ncbi:MAG: hypothetical protein LBQ32_05355 [Burkholderiaceae bacterium]|nr:hypothetical protein [Burkholderiaceae bacterium]
MKNIMAVTAASACVLALTACGGGDDSSALSRADEGVWSNLDNQASINKMQAVILSDGSYFGIVSQTGVTPPSLCVLDVLHGTASVASSNVSGAYTSSAYTGIKGTYSGTVSAQNSLDLTFNDPSNPLLAGASSHFNMNYDHIYSQTASLSAIAGTYLNQVNVDCPTFTPPQASGNYNYNYIYPNLIISNSNLTVVDQYGKNIMTGSIAPHGASVNVFDVSLTTAVAFPAYSMSGLFSGNNDLPAGTVYKGILFQTSSDVQNNNIEIVASAGNSAYFYRGKK